VRQRAWQPRYRPDVVEHADAAVEIQRPKSTLLFHGSMSCLIVNCGCTISFASVDVSFVVRRCHAFVLLIGTRFGGEYQNQGKSITWRE
jgi:hypothetical protein